MKIKHEFSSGCVIFKKQGNKLLFAIGKHSGYHKWVLPKGLIEAGENKINTAIREAEEELGIKVKIVKKKPIHITRYSYMADFKKEADNSRRVTKYAEGGGTKTKVQKTVYFYLAEYISGNISKHGWEMEDAGWFELEKACSLMKFEDEKEALKRVNDILLN